VSFGTGRSAHAFILSPLVPVVGVLCSAQSHAIPAASRFFILAPSGPCERQLRCTERPLLASQPHTPAPDRAPSSQQARPPRLPPSSPNERTCEHKAEHAGPPTAKSLPEWCEQEPWPPPSCRHPLSPHPRPLAVTSHLTSSPPPPIVLVVAGPRQVFIMIPHTTNFILISFSTHLIARLIVCTHSFTTERTSHVCGCFL
jgi:hypothetical protein